MSKMPSGSGPSISAEMVCLSAFASRRRYRTGSQQTLAYLQLESVHHSFGDFGNSATVGLVPVSPQHLLDFIDAATFASHVDYRMAVWTHWPQVSYRIDLVFPADLR